MFSTRKKLPTVWVCVCIKENESRESVGLKEKKIELENHLFPHLACRVESGIARLAAAIEKRVLRETQERG